MKKALLFTIFFRCLLANNILDKSPFKEIPNDLNNYFSGKTFLTLFTGFTLGGIMANTDIDQSIQDLYQKKIRSEESDRLLTFWKKLGQEEVLIAYGSLGLFSMATNNMGFGSFTKNLLFNSGRAFIIGSIPLQITRTLTGGQRPAYTYRSSYWSPLTSPRGVSGHTYTGAILFITWAKMVDGISYKTLLYGLSTLTGLSRINDEYHYPSQALLGWLMAYVACDAVNHTNSNFNFSVDPERVSLSFDF